MSKDRDTIVLSDKKVTTRRRFELMTVNEVHLLTGRAIKEVDEAMALVEGSWVEDGEMHIEILVTQKMKKVAG